MTLLSLYVLSVAFFNYLLLPGVSLARPPWILALLLIGRAGWQSLRSGWIPRPGPLGLALMLFGVTTLANGIFAYTTDLARFADYARTEFQFLLMLGVVFAFVRARLDAPAVARLLKVWVLIAALAATFGIYEGFARVIGLPVPDLPIAAKGYTSIHVKEFFGFFAVSSWFAEPSWLGSFLLVPLVYVVSLLLLDPPPPFGFRKKSWTGALAALLTLGLFLSLSQAAYATLVVVGLPMLWSLRGRLRFGWMVKVVGAPALLILISTVVLTQRGADIVRAQRERFSSIFADWDRPERAWQITSYSVRMTNMRGALTLWSTAPIMGVGINQVRHEPQARHLLTDPASGSVDSGMFQLLVDQGLIGLLAFALALVILWERLRAARARASDPGIQFLLWFLMWALLTDVVNSVVTHPWQHPQRWLVISLAASFLAARPEGDR